MNPDPCCAHRKSPRTLILMEKKRHHSLHPKPVTPLPPFRGIQPRDTRRGHAKLPRANFHFPSHLVVVVVMIDGGGSLREWECCEVLFPL